MEARPGGSCDSRTVGAIIAAILLVFAGLSVGYETMVLLGNAAEAVVVAHFQENDIAPIARIADAINEGCACGVAWAIVTLLPWQWPGRCVPETPRTEVGSPRLVMVAFMLVAVATLSATPFFFSWCCTLQLTFIWPACVHLHAVTQAGHWTCTWLGGLLVAWATHSARGRATPQILYATALG
jgi:hypothetical protein